MRWYDREPMAVWLPLSAVAAATVQTVAYTGYKLFYNSFGVRPEEVGYDYASLFPRTAYQLALIIALGLLLLSIGSLVIAFYAGIGKPIWDDLRRPAGTVTAGGRAAGAIFVALCVTTAIARITGLNALWVLIGSIALILGLGHAHARAQGTPQHSLLSETLTARTYRGPRRIVLLLCAAFVPVLDASVGRDAASLLVLVAILYVIDRVLPVVDDDGIGHARGGGTSAWLRRTGVLLAAGAVAFAFLAVLPSILDASKIDSKVRQVRVGQRLSYSLLNPLTLAEPRADLVTVRWIAQNPPPPFAGRRSINLTYFGQSGGTAVFYRPENGLIYRMPSAAVEIEAGAMSLLP